jgi:polyhydroxybutyrate depolymerase
MVEGLGARAERRLLSALLAGAIALTASSCSSSTSRASLPTAAAPAPTTTASGTGSGRTTAVRCIGRPHAAGQFSQAFVYRGVTRTYQLYVPRAYYGTDLVPLLFDFHGYGSNAIEQMVYGNFEPLADRNDFLVVAPNGQGTDRHFNLTGEPGLQNDVTMVLALLDHIEATFCVDTARVFATGMSDGGAMTSVLACVAFNRFAAFGAVAVDVYQPGCGGSRPVSIVAFHGTADPVVPFNGGRVSCCGGPVLASAPGALAGWAAHDHCDRAFVDTRLGTQVQQRTWSGCEGGSSVVFYTIVGGGHTWPGSIPVPGLDMTTSQINASDTIWAFFASHPLHR